VAEYFVQQKALSTNARTLVQDEKGNNIYLLVGRWGSRGDTVSLYDLSGNLLGKIQQKSIMPGMRFSIYEKNDKIASMQRLPKLHKDSYFISGLGWLAEGEFAEHRYEIKRGSELIMEMLGAHMFKGDFYSLLIPKEENAPLAILIAAVLDYWLYNTSRKKILPFRKLTITLAD